MRRGTTWDLRSERKIRDRTFQILSVSTIKERMIPGGFNARKFGLLG